MRIEAVSNLRSCTRTLASLSPALLLCSIASGQSSFFSTDIHYDTGLVVASDEQAINNGFVIGGLFAPGGLPDQADVDAIHILPGGVVLFSLDSALHLGGVVYRSHDIIRFDGSNWSKALDGRAAGIPDGVNIDAVASVGSLLLFSVDVGTNLGSMLGISDSDIVAFDGSDFSLISTPEALGLDPAADVDALHVDEQGRILFSVDIGGEVDGMTYSDQDLLALDSSFSLAIDNNSAAWGPVDLDAWTATTAPADLIFSDGFE